MLDLKHVKTFLMVQKVGSFSKAAEGLDMAQPTVSLHIKSLESYLGYLLFDRVGKRVIISPDGSRFLPLAQEMVRLASAALHPAGEDAGIVGELNICIVQSICAYKMPAYLKAFQEKNPRVQTKISVNRPSTYMLEQLRAGEFDCSIVLEAPFDIPSLKSHILWTDSLEVVAHVGHPLAERSSVKVEQLLFENFIFPDASAHYRRLFERRLLEHGITPQVVLEIDNFEAIKRSVMAGIGLAVLPRYAIESELLAHHLVPLSIDWRKLTVSARLIWHKDKLMNDAAHGFIDMMTTL